MAINFPSSPSVNDIHSEGGVRWKWNGSSWTRSSGAAVTDTITTANDNSTTTLYPVLTSGTGAQTAKIATTATKNISFDASDGDLTIGGNLSVGGTITYEDVKNVDSIGIVTARSGVDITADNKYLKIGAGNDISIVHTGSESFISNATGHLTRRSDVHKWENYAGNSEYGRFTSDGELLVGTTVDNGFKFKVSDGGGYEFAFAPNDSSINSLVNYNRSGGAYVDCKLVQKELQLWSGTSPVERLRIDANGDINLGNNPTNQYGYKLNIQDSAIIYAQTASSNGTELKLYLDHSNTIANFGTVSTSHLAFVTTNLERLRIKSDGKVGIGTDNPSEVLHVLQSGTTAAEFRLENSEGYLLLRADSNVATYGAEQHIFHNRANNTEYLRIKSDGKVGINNSAPLYPMHFKNAMGSSPSWIHMEVTGSNAVGGGGGIAFDTSASNNATNNSLYLATIKGIRNSSDDGSNDLVFSTSKSGVTGDDGNTHSPKEKLRIDSSGNVKIGSGSAAFAVGGGLEIDTGSAATIRLEDSGSSSSVEIQNTGGVIKQNMYNNQPWTVAYNSSEVFRITSGGSVHIGNTYTANGAADNLIVGTGQDADGWQGITIYSHSNDGGALYFADGASTGQYAGFVQYGHGDNSLQFGAGSSERLRITSDKVMFSVDAKVDSDNSRDLGASGARWRNLHLGTSARIGAIGTTASTAGDDLVIEGSSDSGLSIISGSSSSANIYFGDSSDADVGRFAYQHNDNAFDFHTNGGGTARLRIASNGALIQKAGSGDNQFYSQRINTAGSNGNYFFHMKAQDSSGNNVGEAGFHRDTAADDARFIIKTRNTGGSSQERFRITSKGYVNMPDQPAFFARGSLTFTDWNTYEYVTWGSENFDNSGSWDGTKFTCPVGAAGDYLFQVEFLAPANADNGNNNYILYALFKGTSGQNLWRQDWGSSSNYNASFSGMVLQLAEGDEVRVAFHKSYGRPYASGYNSFTGCKLN